MGNGGDRDRMQRLWPAPGAHVLHAGPRQRVHRLRGHRATVGGDLAGRLRGGAAAMKKIVLIVALFAWPAAAQVPSLIQAYTTSDNPLGIGIDGNNFKFNTPNPVLSGNALVLRIT